MIEFDSFDGRLEDYIGRIVCRNCKPGTPCNRHVGRNVKEINAWLRGKKAQRNPFLQRDDWEQLKSIPFGKGQEN